MSRTKTRYVDASDLHTLTKSVARRTRSDVMTPLMSPSHRPQSTSHRLWPIVTTSHIFLPTSPSRDPA